MGKWEMKIENKLGKIHRNSPPEESFERFIQTQELPLRAVDIPEYPQPLYDEFEFKRPTWMKIHPLDTTGKCFYSRC